MTRRLPAIGPILLLASSAAATPLGLRATGAGSLRPLLPPAQRREAPPPEAALPVLPELEFSLQANIRMLRSGFVQASIDRSLSAELMGRKAVFREFRLAGPPLRSARYQEAVLCLVAGAGLFAFGIMRRRAMHAQRAEAPLLRPRMLRGGRHGPAARSFPTSRAG